MTEDAKLSFEEKYSENVTKLEILKQIIDEYIVKIKQKKKYPIENT